MAKVEQKGFRKNYYIMAVFFFMMIFAFRLSSHLVGLMSLVGIFIANPSFVFKVEKYRWFFILVLLVSSLILYPDINGLKVPFDQNKVIETDSK